MWASSASFSPSTPSGIRDLLPKLLRGAFEPSGVLKRRRLQPDLLKSRRSCGAVEADSDRERVGFCRRPEALFGDQRDDRLRRPEITFDRDHVRLSKPFREDRLSIEWDERAREFSESRTRTTELPAAGPNRCGCPLRPNRKFLGRADVTESLSRRTPHRAGSRAEPSIESSSAEIVIYRVVSSP